MTLDALNIYNSQIMAPNKNLMNSLESKKVEFYTVNNSTGTAIITSSQSTPPCDISNFLIGIPFSNDIDFQGCLTSNGNINFKLASTSSTINTIASTYTASSTSSIGATVMFCCDCALMIKVVPYSNQPECRLVTERIV